MVVVLSYCYDCSDWMLILRLSYCSCILYVVCSIDVILDIDIDVILDIDIDVILDVVDVVVIFSRLLPFVGR